MTKGICMTEDQREIRRKKRVIEYAEKNGNIKTACCRFGIARSTFYLWRDRYRESGDEGLTRRNPESQTFLHPETAKACNVEQGERVEVESATGRIKIQVAIRDDMPPGLVRIPHGW